MFSTIARLTAFSVTLVGLVAIAAAARDAECDNAATQREIEECSRIEFERTNRALEAIYYEGLANLGGRQRDLVEKSQEAWLRYRDANCEAAAAFYAGGSLAGTVLQSCKERLARERLAELRTLMEEPPLPGVAQ